jgi:ethanolamine utilization protein EutJ
MLATIHAHHRATEFLLRASERFQRPLGSRDKTLHFGIDLGTATTVLCAINSDGQAVYWDQVVGQTVRDGVVVDFPGAIHAVKELKVRAERALRTRIDEAATAHPPGVPVSECRACRYVLERADISCRNLVDEVSAAQAILCVDDGAIADVGGGTTGVGVFRNGKLALLSDLPGGGHHLDLILAGALRIAVEEAEQRKRLWDDDYTAILRPGIERIATSIRRQMGSPEPPGLHLVGGTLMLPGAGRIVERYLGVPTFAYPHAHLVTPFGIAMS